MRILILPSLFFPNYYGGVQTYSLNLAKSLREQGHEVAFLCIEYANRGDAVLRLSEELFEGFALYRLHIDMQSRPKISIWTYCDHEAAAVVERVIREWAPTVLHVTHFGGISTAIVDLAHQYGIAVVFTATDFSVNCLQGGTLIKADGQLCDGHETVTNCWSCLRHHSRLGNAIYAVTRHASEKSLRVLSTLNRALPRPIGMLELPYYLLRRFETLRPTIREIDIIIAPSPWMRDVLVMNGADPSRIVVSPYGVVDNRPVGYAKVPSGHIRFGFVGRFTPIKGLHLLIEAFSTLPRSSYATLDVYGAPDKHNTQYGEHVANLARNDLRIRLHGAINTEQLPTIHSNLDVLIAPSLWHENSPIVILESFLYGTPVIASNMCGISNLIVPNVNGLLIDIVDSNALTQALQNTINNPWVVKSWQKQTHVLKTIQADALWLTEVFAQLRRGNKYALDTKTQ